MGWAGWGAGPAGAGATGGPSRIFLAVVLVAAIVVTAVSVKQGAYAAAGVTGAAALYFAARLLGGLGKGEE